MFNCLHLSSLEDYKGCLVTPPVSNEVMELSKWEFFPQQ